MGEGEERGRRSSSFLWALAASVLCHLLLFLLFPSWVPGLPGGRGGLAGGELVRVLFLGQVEVQPPEAQPVEKPEEALPAPAPVPPAKKESPPGGTEKPSAKVKPPAVLTSPAGQVEVASPPQKGEVTGKEKPKEVRQEQKAQAPSAAPPPSGEGMVLLGRPPVYPKAAENEGVEGVVQLFIWVKAEGELAAVQVARSSGDARLDNVAERTVVNEWRFKPAQQDYRLQVSVEFSGGKPRLHFEGLEMGVSPPPPGEEEGKAKGGSTP